MNELEKEKIMNNKLWISTTKLATILAMLFSVLSLFSIVLIADAQDVTTAEPDEHVPLTEESQTAKQVYTQLMHAVYLQSFNKNLVQTKMLYDQLVKLSPDSAYVYYRRGQLRYEMQDVPGAEADMEKALAIDDSNILATWQLAQILAHRAYYSQGKNVTKVLDTVKRVTELDPTHFMAQQMLADLSFQLREYETAEKALKALTRIMPFEPSFHKRLGDLYQELNRTEEAVEAYKRVIKIKPDDIGTLKAMGFLNLKSGHLEEAKKTFEQILTLAPQDVRSNLGLGLVLQELAYRMQTDDNWTSQNEPIAKYYKGQTLITDAEKYLGRAIFLSLAIVNRSDNGRRQATYRRLAVDAQYALGNVYLLFEKYEDAKEIFTQLLANDDEHIGALYGIASAYQSMEDFDNAEAYLRKTLSLEPAHEYALNALGYLYAEKGTKLDEAEALIKRALEQAPEKGEYLDSLGWVFFKQGRFAEAVTMLEKAIQQSPKNVIILIHLGDAYLKNSEPDKARDAWKEAQTVEPENAEIKERLSQ